MTQFIVKSSFFNFDRRGNAKPVKAGVLLKESEFNGLTPSKKSKCEVYVGDRNLYTEEEADALVLVYQEQGRTPESKAYLMTLIGDRHTEGSVDRSLTQLQVLDNTHPLATEWNVSGIIRQAALKADPNRFG